ncbi:hypothetical protein [Silvimonas iriomotensis]|uniref:Uncharacterized protein n=1 Tax=Silvimonas iriomotensis TaxID=449662 RepID=A0ABQ2PEN7_9NEIS|nr:hypothetical protein [Silvimonas iriomotensis]GGP24013.1 hypothetical protein GCM10010970_40130 [Silvimonas iriomotensis]
MNSVLIVKLCAGPLVIALASLAGKRWGPTFAGLIGGLPLIASCVMVTLWLAYGQDYTMATAFSAPSGLWANALYMIALGWSARRFGWAGMLACGWAVYLVSAWALAASGLAQQDWVRWGAIPALWGALYLLPAIDGAPIPRPLPHSELFARMAVALALVATLTTLSQQLGTSLTGVLSGGPVAATVIPAFTRARGDSNGVVYQVRGFLIGLIGFGLSFLLLVPLAGHIGAWAALPAALVAAGTSLALNWFSRRRSRT